MIVSSYSENTIQYSVDNCKYVVCAAMRGRYDENKKINQTLEQRNDSCTNTLTTVQKDNLLIEIEIKQ